MKIFLHYSWDNEPHKDWVLRLANRLVADGVDLYFDRYDLKPGANNLHFMEQIEHADKVILVMSEGYKSKAEDRRGGIGYEYQILASILSRSLTDTKFIPILRGDRYQDCIPMLLSSYLYIDFSDDTTFEERYIALLRTVFDEPEIIKPILGKKPDFMVPKPSKTADVVADIFSLGWSRQKVKKVLGPSQSSVGIQEQYWSHGLEVYYNRHWNRVDGVLANHSNAGVQYEDEIYGVKIGDTFAQVKSRLGKPLNWGIPDEHLSMALYLIDGVYLTIPIWRAVPNHAPMEIKQGTVMSIGVAAEHSILACTPLVMIAIEEIRQGAKRPTLLEHRRGKLDYDPKALYWREHYELSAVQIGIYGGYFVQVCFTESKKELVFWLYDLAWDKMVIRSLVEQDRMDDDHGDQS
ncbi:toll/interleukin-1 receptor domain-containing protein [Pedobacter sp. PF22-3]|uniref:toll/interleukin-1 receptor domain-containing protein n=1 Tax=Pedobacter sp. PF22-3 TaxID=2994467 RepID=UPI0022462FA2|nr:toll/interleukin-1 receptor domain-containing protein [Pedobacter sp. PF22-3]MCX2494723.1 toll/interleukin-1 receptor domain-containing protein [Pedobacter sp. PF22-3]